MPNRHGILTSIKSECLRCTILPCGLGIRASAMSSRKWKLFELTRAGHAPEFNKRRQTMIVAHALKACPPMAILILLSIAFAFGFPATDALAASAASVRRGKTFAVVNCSQCHSIDRHTRSRLSTAPPFRTLHGRYPVETLGDALSEGLSIGHPRMPEFRLDPAEVRDFTSFLKSLE